MSSWASDQLPPCFSDFRWSRSVDPGRHFGPALGSLMSSQSANFASMGVGLGSSKPRLVLQRAPVPSEFGSPKLGQLNSASNLSPAFAEVRPARVFRFEGENFGLGGSHFELNPTSSQPLTGDGFQVEHLESSSQDPGLNGVKLEMKNGELGICREEASMSDPICASGEASLGGHRGSNARKRRTHQKNKENEIASPKSVTDPPMVADEEDCVAKRHRHTENNAEIASQSDGSRNDEKNQGKEGNVKPSEPPKDYIHVRARRGQATDSHSLAERVRREKISQRMKLLQDLVPGCSKVTGKAVMLDEIINYVQSLQRQVEFLSMKLATVNPDMDFSNLMNLHPEDMIQICGHVPSSIYPFETMAPSSYANQPPQGNPLNRIAANRTDSYTLGPTRLQNFNSHRQPCINGYGNVSSQVGAFWEDDLQSVVQIGMGQGQEIVSSSQSFNGGALSAAEMKTEP